VSEGTLHDLERTVENVRWSDEPTDTTTQYVIFSRSGYTDDLKRRAEARDEVRLFGLSDLFDPS